MIIHHWMCSFDEPDYRTNQIFRKWGQNSAQTNEAWSSTINHEQQWNKPSLYCHIFTNCLHVCKYGGIEVLSGTNNLPEHSTKTRNYSVDNSGI